ncbi:MAG: APC family permease [Sphingomicrobium sp.]
MPPRSIGAWGIGFIAINAMIGSGIFGLPGKLDAALGAFAPLFLLGAGLAVMGIALCYADLASRFDRSGGPQLFAAAAFGNFIGFEAGWMNWASRVAATAANSTVLGAYALAFWPSASATLVAAAAILLVTLINLARLERAVAALGVISLFKLLPLFFVALLALGQFGLAGPVTLPSFDTAESLALAALYAFVGFEAATVPSGETRDPRRAVPRALIASLAFVTAIYVVVQLAYAASGLGASDTPVADLATATIGPWGGLLIAATATVSVLGNLSSAFATMPRVTAAMAEQGELPIVFNRRMADGAPAISILLYAAVALLLAVTGSFVFLAIVATLSRLLVYALCMVAIPVLDRREGKAFRPLRGALLPAAALTFCLWAASQSGQGEWLTFAAFLSAGALLYGIARVTAKASA